MKWLGFVLAICALSGCTLNIPVRAEFQNGRLVFTIDDRGEHWCLDDFQLKDRATGEIVWHIEPISWTGNPQFCSDDFPLAYGQTPRWMKVAVQAKPLKSGHTYDIEGWTGNLLSGAFTFNVQYSVANVEPKIS